jgi:hypothetical protein
MGVKKMGNGVINLFTGSKEKIRKFGIFAKNFIAQPKSNPNNQNPN